MVAFEPADLIDILHHGSAKLHLAETGASELTGADVAARARGVRTALVEAGVAAGDYVGIDLPDALDWLAVDLACLAMGAISVPLDGRNCEQAFELVGQRFVVVGTGPEYTVDIADIARRSSDSDSGAGCPSNRTHEHVCVKFTSGTSGGAKAVLARTSHMRHLGQEVIDAFELGRDDVLLVVVPMSVFLQRVLVYAVLVQGGTVVLGTPRRCLRLAQMHNPTIVAAPPRFFDAMLELVRRDQRIDPAAQLANLFGSRVRCMWTGSAPTTPDVLTAYENAGLPLMEGYGMTETGMIAKNTPAHHKRGTVGRPFAGIELEFVDGEILVRGGFFANDGYVGEVDGVFRGPRLVATGDHGYLDEDGFLVLTGRTDDLIALADGMKVQASVVEQAIMANDLVSDCVVVGRGRSGLVALVVPRRPETTSEAVAEAAKQSTSHLSTQQQVFRSVVVAPFTVEDGTLTETGKKRRNEIERRYSDDVEALFR